MVGLSPNGSLVSACRAEQEVARLLAEPLVPPRRVQQEMVVMFETRFRGIKHDPRHTHGVAMVYDGESWIFRNHQLNTTTLSNIR